MRCSLILRTWQPDTSFGSAALHRVGWLEAINQAQTQRAAAHAELAAAAPVQDILSDAAVYAVIDSLGDVGHALNRAN
ncbi:MAG: hypothetical protein M3308_06090 [Actinomycetota bacterium]|nr:hypothetical protein [Actinomycetota bacterium]